MRSIWIKSYSSLKESVKTRRVARKLNIHTAQVIGHLHMLWWWVMEQAERGDLSAFEAWEIEDIMQWSGEEGALLSALIEFRFIDEDENGRRVHDWSEHAGSVLAQVEANRERQRRFYEKKKQTQQGIKPDSEKPNALDNVLDNAVDKRREEKEKIREDKIREDESPQLRCGESNSQSEFGHGKAATQAGDSKNQNSESAQTEKQTPSILPEVVEMWNAQLAPLGFPAVSKATPARVKAFHARLNDDAQRRSADWWGGVFDRISRSDFMKTEAKNGAGWLRFDWILNENNLVKVCEGKYDNKEKREKSYQELEAEYFSSLYD